MVLRCGVGMGWGRSGRRVGAGDKRVRESQWSLIL